MSCARGCCPTQADHYRSLSVSSSAREDLTKTTTDDHGSHTVDVTERWHGQDVTVRPKTLSLKVTAQDQE